MASVVTVYLSYFNFSNSKCTVYKIYMNFAFTLNMYSTIIEHEIDMTTTSQWRTKCKPL
jgi:hypothetical protein